MNKVKASKEDKKVFNDLNKLIIDINNNKVKKVDAVERLNKSISDLGQLKQKQSTAFQNKLIHVVYQLFNSFGFNKGFTPLFYQIKSEKTEEEPVSLKIKSLSERSKSGTKKPTQLKQIDLNEITKSLWFNLSRRYLASLVKDVVNNLDNKDYQTTINNDKYDFKMQNYFFLKTVTKKYSNNEAHELYENLIKAKVDKLKNSKGKGKDKRINILNNLENIASSIFDGVYLHYFDKPKITEESIAKRTKLSRQRLDIFKEKEKNIHNKLFNYYSNYNYLSPSNMLSILSNASDEINKNRVNSINEKLTKIKNIVKNVPKDKAFKIEENEKIIDTIERILELNSENQLGLGLNILTPNQILSRLPITLAQLKAGSDSEKLKKRNQVNTVFFVQIKKNLQKMSIIT